MNRYTVFVSRNCTYEFDIIAANKDEAENKANEMFDEMQFRGSEMYDDYNGGIKLEEENVKEEEN